MPAKKISQRDATATRKRLAALETAVERQRSVWSQEYIHGVEIASAKWDAGTDYVPNAVRTARKLGHAVVAVGDDTGKIRFVALPHPKVS